VWSAGGKTAVASTGTAFGGLNLSGAVAGKPLELGPMGINFGSRMQEITDGTSNTIDLVNVWRPLATIAGEEIISPF